MTVALSDIKDEKIELTNALLTFRGKSEGKDYTQYAIMFAKYLYGDLKKKRSLMTPETTKVSRPQSPSWVRAKSTRQTERWTGGRAAVPASLLAMAHFGVSPVPTTAVVVSIVEKNAQTAGK